MLINLPEPYTLLENSLTCLRETAFLVENVGLALQCPFEFVFIIRQEAYLPSDIRMGKGMGCRLIETAVQVILSLVLG